MRTVPPSLWAPCAVCEGGAACSSSLGPRWLHLRGDLWPGVKTGRSMTVTVRLDVWAVNLVRVMPTIEWSQALLVGLAVTVLVGCGGLARPPLYTPDELEPLASDKAGGGARTYSTGTASTSLPDGGSEVPVLEEALLNSLMRPRRSDWVCPPRFRRGLPRACRRNPDHGVLLVATGTSEPGQPGDHHGTATRIRGCRGHGVQNYGDQNR